MRSPSPPPIARRFTVRCHDGCKWDHSSLALVNPALDSNVILACLSNTFLSVAEKAGHSVLMRLKKCTLHTIRSHNRFYARSRHQKKRDIVSIIMKSGGDSPFAQCSFSAELTLT